MKWIMKRDRGEKIFFLRNVSEPPNPPDELISPKCFEKNISDELFLHFSSKFQNLTVFHSIIYMIRIRFFGPGELIQRTFLAAQYI